MISPKKIVSDCIEYLNISSDQEMTDRENLMLFRFFIKLGMALCVFLALTELLVYRKFTIGFLAGSFAILFLIAYSLVNWDYVKAHTTTYMWLLFFLFLILLGIADSMSHLDKLFFIYPAALLMIPPLILDRPWRIILLIIGSSLPAFFIYISSGNPDMVKGNIVRLTGVCFLSMLISCRTSYKRIRSIQIRNFTKSAAEHDPLTGIYNRGGGTMLIRNHVDRHESGTFLIIDVDDFKHVNDYYGHQRGDEVLQNVATALKNSFKESDIVMRMGGDEFIVYAIGMVDYKVVVKRHEQLLEAIHQVMISEEDQKHVTVSIGAVINDGSYPSYDSLYQAADNSLYRVKEKGKDGFHIHGAGYH